MDISSFSGLAKSFDDGMEVEILHPVTGKPTGLSVRVASYQSERVKAAQRRMANAALRDQKRNPKKTATVEEIEEKTTDIIVAAVLSWEGFEKDGKPLECTPENVRMVVENPDLWFIAEQIDKAADDQLAFMKASRKS
ncbi:hypothetical protein [Hyphomonas sp. UBA4494]|jgi:hypothetical protein|uniref:hypothetical protein n=1 Tax=Hyphomonas sp. UBA4494 TaxID=1946631 RepID=UPI0025C41174|nr:hypothetical protein [Hyphomonas sp. UBA4494]